MRILVLSFMLCLLSVVACEKSKPEVWYPKVTYEMRQLERTIGVDVDTSKSYAIIQVAYPEITMADRDTVKTLINQYIYCHILDQFEDSLCQTTIESQMDNFIAEYKDFKDFVPDLSQHWESRTTVSVINDTLGIFSIGLTTYSYTGGAHPNASSFFANFSSYNGDYIRLEDVLIEGYQEELTKIAEIQFRQAKNIGLNDSLSSAGYWFADDTFYLNDNYLFGKDNLIFFYNLYEIAPFSMGSSEIKIPYKLMGSLIKPESVLGQYFYGRYGYEKK
ncbi:MAG: DUF4163 domain-containing protein [Candidatus Zixiibacteriota bacterium]